MSRSLMLLMTLALLLSPSCGLSEKAGATLDDYKAVAVKLNKLGEKIEAVPAQIQAAKDALDEKINAAEDKARAAGLKVDGTEAEFWDSVKQNPGKAWSAGLSTLAMAAFGVWQRNRAKRKDDALASVVDTIDTLPDQPVTKAQILDEIAKHPRMNVGAKLETTAVKSR